MAEISLTKSSDPGDGDPARRVPAARVAAVREFNRFYTNVLGLLREGLLETPYSLTEARVVFELARKDQTQVGDLRRWLDVDAGYLSRILTRFEADGLVARARSDSDGRRQVVELTEAGRRAFAMLDTRSGEQIRALLAGIPEPGQRRLVAAMASVCEILDGAPTPAAIVIRPPAPGDLGWVVQRHGALYAAEHGWDASFEALVARVVADHAARDDHGREAGWIAELNGEAAGCVFCMRKSDTVAQLRLLLVEPHARGHGIGGRLVAECVAFARRAGYHEVVLWTNDVLHAARRIYRRAGFELTGSQAHHSFGRDLVGEDWRLSLGRPGPTDAPPREFS